MVILRSRGIQLLLAVLLVLGVASAAPGVAHAEPAIPAASVQVVASPTTHIEALPSVSDVACGIPVFGMVCQMGRATKGALGAAANAFKGTVFEKMVNSLIDGWERLMLWSLSWWIALPSPNLNGQAMQQIIQKVGDYTFYLQVFLLIASLMFMALRMMMSERGFAEEQEEQWKMIGRAVFATALLGSLIALATKVSDATSTWILTAAMGDEGAGNLLKNLVKGDILTAGLGHVVIGLIFFFGVVGALLQLLLLVVRQAMLIVVVVALPLAAASSGTGTGSEAYQKMIAWTIAFLLFKPVGALVYMIAFTAARSDMAKDPQVMVLGVILLSLTCLILPALMRLIVPAVGSMGGAGGAAAGGMVGGLAGAAVAKGGQSAGSAAGGGSGGGGGGSPLSGRGGGGGGGGPSPSGGGGNHAAMGAGKAAGAGGGAAGGAAAGPVGAAVGAAAEGAGKAKAAMGAAGGEADATPNPTGAAAPAAASTSVPPLTSGTGEHRMAA